MITDKYPFQLNEHSMQVNLKFIENKSEFKQSLKEKNHLDSDVNAIQ